MTVHVTTESDSKYVLIQRKNGNTEIFKNRKWQGILISGRKLIEVGKELDLLYTTKKTYEETLFLKTTPVKTLRVRA